MHGIVDEKTDVFAFGVLILELITGRRALDYTQQSLVIWVCLYTLSIILLTIVFEKQFLNISSLLFLGQTPAEEEQNSRAC